MQVLPHALPLEQTLQQALGCGPPRPVHQRFWANDDARKLAEGLKAGLAQINIVKS
jgi:hypothetical protein